MTHPTSGPVSSMLRLFRDGVASYQPAIQGFDLETGDPQVSLDNVQRLVDAGLVISDFLVRSPARWSCLPAASNTTPLAFASEPQVWRRTPWPTLPPRPVLARKRNFGKSTTISPTTLQRSTGEPERPAVDLPGAVTTEPV